MKSNNITNTEIGENAERCTNCGSTDLLYETV
jgi:hypothetical protein